MTALLLCTILFFGLRSLFDGNMIESNPSLSRERKLLVGRPRNHQTTMHHIRRKLEDQWNDYDDNGDVGNNNNEGYNEGDDDLIANAEQYSEQKFVDMFWTAPSSWNALQWVFFSLLLSINSLLFFCFCIACFIPRCCHKSTPMMYAAMV